METIADKIIDGQGGTTAVSRMTQAPISTVHSWRKNGIPPSRLAHLKLAAQAAYNPIDPALIEAAEAEAATRIAA